MRTCSLRLDRNLAFRSCACCSRLILMGWWLEKFKASWALRRQPCRITWKSSRMSLWLPCVAKAHSCATPRILKHWRSYSDFCTPSAAPATRQSSQQRSPKSADRKEEHHGNKRCCSGEIRYCSAPGARRQRTPGRLLQSDELLRRFGNRFLRSDNL